MQIDDIVDIQVFYCEGIDCCIGEPDFSEGIMYGINVSKPRGNNDGFVGARMYFDGTVFNPSKSYTIN